MRAARWGIGAVGVVLGLVGLWNVRDFEGAQLVSLGLWLAGGVVLHDFVLAPVVVAAAWAGSRLLPRWSWRAAAVGLLGWATVSLASLNVLLGVGGKPDNDTLLNRPYVASWLVLSLVWWAAVAALALRERRRAR